MTVSKLSTLVSTTWLKDQIFRLSSSGKLDPNLRVLDTSWAIGQPIDSYKEYYQNAHIPSALYFDLTKIHTKGTPGPGPRYPITDSNVFQDYAQSLGISNHTHVVTYDRFASRDAFRTWFLFRLFGHEKISVLNGGLRRWLMDGSHVTTDEPDVEKGNFKARLRTDLLRNYDDMVKNVSTKTEQVVDGRGPKNVFGTEESDGRIPGSKNIPFNLIFNEDYTVKSHTDLKKLFDTAGVDLNQPLVSSCLTGQVACGLIAAAHLLGKENVALYNGSFTEWHNTTTDENLIARGED